MLDEAVSAEVLAEAARVACRECCGHVCLDDEDDALRVVREMAKKGWIIRHEGAE